MNKNLGISLGVILVIAISGGIYLNQKKENVMVKETSEAAMVKATPEAMMEKENAKYIEYANPQTLEIKKTKRVLYFYANWCSSCIPADKEFKAGESMIPEGVTVIRVNYNDPDTDSNEKALATKYGITYQHTFVQIDENGEEIVKWNGGAIAELIANTQ